MIIFLIGFMGSGKTTLGKQVSRITGHEFVDMDYIIEKEVGMTISQIFEQMGESWFRNKETEVFSRFSSESNLVVATGGGAPCFNNNMDLMNRVGITVYIKPDTATLASRLENARYFRPLIASLTHDELLNHINERLTAREPYYNQAKCIIKGNNIKPEHVIRLVFGDIGTE